MKLETFPYSKKINHLSSIFIDARQTNILNFSILDVPKLRCRTNCFKTRLNVFSSLEGSLRQTSTISTNSVFISVLSTITSRYEIFIFIYDYFCEITNFV